MERTSRTEDTINVPIFAPRITVNQHSEATLAATQDQSGSVFSQTEHQNVSARVTGQTLAVDYSPALMAGYKED